VPEGHILHRLAREYSDSFSGHSVRVSSPQGRFAESAAQLNGHVVTGALAVGKHLFVNFDNDQAVHIHLGLYGDVTVGSGPAPEPVGQIRMRIEGGERYADLRGPTRCELATPDQVKAVAARLGEDPIRVDADVERVWQRTRSSRSAIGSLLMDQGTYAGVGNIFRAEVLFRARVNPFREARALNRRRFDQIWVDLVDLMTSAVEVGRIDTVRPEHLPEVMGREARSDAHGGEVYVYRRDGQPCLICGQRVKVADMQGRWLYWCSRCQRS